MTTHTALPKHVEQPPAAANEPSPSADDSGRYEPAPAVTLRFHLGQLTATPEAVDDAHAAGVNVVEAILRHLGGDWGDVDDSTASANNLAVAAGGGLRSAYRLPGTTNLLVVTTDATPNVATPPPPSPPKPLPAGHDATRSPTRRTPRRAARHRQPPTTHPGTSILPMRLERPQPRRRRRRCS